MFVTFLQRVKSLFVEVNGTEDAYGGYTPSKVRPQQPPRTFDEAIKVAPVREEWVDENHWGYVWHVLRNIPAREWCGGAAFVAVMFLLLMFMPSY